MREVIDLLRETIDEQQLHLMEIEVAALLRNGAFTLNSEDTWIAAENAALAVVVNLEDRLASFVPEDVDGRNDRYITLAAHILWSTAQRRFQLSDNFEATFLALNSAIAFLYSANISGATAVALEIKEWGVTDPVFSLIRDLIEGFRLLPDPNIPRKSTTVEALRRYYQLAIEGQREASIDLFEIISSELKEVEHILGPAQVAVIYRLERSCEWLTHFLLPNLLENYLGTRNDYANYIRANGPYFAFPSQRQALLQLAGKHKSNTLITFPTSTGKTFLGELLAIEPLIQGEKGVAVYLAPYRAIVSQIVERDKRLIEASGITFIRAMGGYMEGLADVSASERVFFVATPEAFDYAMRAKPEIAERIVSIAVDELHLIEQIGRGTMLECLVSRLRDLQQGRQLRIIGLSAVIGDTRLLQQWLAVPDSHVLRTNWTPAKKRFEIQLSNNRAAFYGDASQVTKSKGSSTLKWNFSSGLSRIPYLNDPRRQQDRARAYDQIADRAARMAVEMFNQFRGGILVVCSSKKDTRLIARKLLNHIEMDQVDTTTRRRLSRLIEQRYPHHRTLLAMLPYRICYHNADVEYEVRDLLQKLIEERYFKVVVSTTTLAEGVDLPFRAVILYRWTHRENSGRQLFSTLLLRNIVGRCGRAGMFVEGDTIFFDNPSDDPEYDDSRVETIEKGYIFPTTLKLQSSLERVNGSTVEESNATPPLESAVLALINQRGSVDEPANYLSKLLLAPAPAVEKYKTHLDNVIRSELQKGEGAIVAANSPITLTEYGRAAVQTGLSIQSASTIVTNLAGLSRPLPRPSQKRDLIREYGLQWDGLFDQAMETVGSLKELDVRNRPGTKQEFPLLVWAWLSGWSMPAIAWIIKFRKDSDLSEKITWLRSPNSPNVELEELIADIQGFCDGYFANAWSRVLRAIGVFVQFSTMEEKERVWLEYQQLTLRIAYGVSDMLAISLLDSSVGFPGGRTEAQIVAYWYRQRGITDIDLLKTSRIRPDPAGLQSTILDPQGICRMSAGIAIDICNWLQDVK